MSKPDRWLNSYEKDVVSQHGEDGVIEKILEVIGDVNNWCVEFGAWDGKHLSNTYNLIHNKNYSAVLIEGDEARFKDLVEANQNNKGVVPVNAFVGASAHDGLDSILAATDIPTDFDLLSIDIDGNDYHVWSAVKKYHPKAVVIEFNPTIPNPVEFVQVLDMSVNQGSSLLSMVNLGKEKNYELVAITKNNAFFVDEKYFPKFEIADNSPDALRSDYSDITYIFNGYDGTVFIRGSGRLKWHHYSLQRVQNAAGSRVVEAVSE